MLSRLRACNRPFVRTSLRMNSGRSSELESAVYRDLTTTCRVTAKTSLLLCVSGGVDSMALLHLMGAIKGKCLPELAIEVLNFNHNLRPEESKLERKSVEKWARHYKFPFHSVERPPDEAFGDSGVQEAAREWRQETVKTLLEQYRIRDSKASLIAAIVGDGTGEGEAEGRKETSRIAVAATGHHMDDQLETMMLKITRGVHVSRMYPMLPISHCGNFIKPLLSVSKEELVEYMHDKNFEWHEDASNTDRKYKRNAVRMDLIPAMAELAGGKEPLYRRLSSMAEQSLQFRGWLEGEAREFILENVFSTLQRGEDICFPVDAFAALPKPVQFEVIHSIAQQSSAVTIDYDHSKQVVSLALEDTKDGQASRSINVAGSWMATRVGKVVRFHDTQLWADLQEDRMTTKCLFGALTITHPATVRVQAQTVGKDEEEEGGSGEGISLCLYNYDYSGDSLPTLVIRYAQAGDKFGSKKLSECLRGWKVPVHERERLYVLAINSSTDTDDDEGTLLGAFLPADYGESIAAPPYCGSGSGSDCTKLTVEIL